MSMARRPATLRLLPALLAVLMLLLAPAPAYAWWDYGHKTVAGIAKENVRPGTRRAIAALLAHAPEIATPTCPLRTIEDASVWPDCVKVLKDRFSYAYSWHYQDVDICRPFDLKAPCRDGNCVSAQIDRNFRLLKDRSVPARERLLALAFLVHFVGDIHQPLHAGEHDDAGGNFVKARYGDYSAEKLNLHSIWDGLLAEHALSAPPPLVRLYSDAEKAELAGGTTTDWSRESWEIAKDVVYPAVMRDPCGPTPKERVTLDNAKLEQLVPVVRKQVERGGLRLARMLDEALG